MPSKLSKRQFQVANLLIQGYSSKEIAGKLKLNTRTVAHHLSRIREKEDEPSTIKAILKIAARMMI